MTETEQLTLELIRYLLDGTAPATDVQTADFGALYDFSQKHGVENMVCAALSALEIQIPPPYAEKYEKAYRLSLALEAQQAYALEQIGAAFEAAGIDYMPLKGSVIKHLYPSPDLRKSGDIDVLIKPEDEPRIDEIMRGLGFSHESDGDDYEVHFSYYKKPFINVEIHRKLVQSDHRSAKFCFAIWQYAKKKENTQHCYELNNEALYTYGLVHLCKHLYEGGAGIRLITDLYLIAGSCSLNEKILAEYLTAARLKELNVMIKKVISSVFKGKKADELTDFLINMIMSSGSYGTLEIRSSVLANDTAAGKLRHLYKKIFPTGETIGYKYKEVKGGGYIKMWLFRAYKILKRGSTQKRADTPAEKSAAMKKIVKAVRSDYI